MITADERVLLARADDLVHASLDRGLSADEVWMDVVDRIKAACVVSPGQLRLIASCSPSRIRQLLLRLERAA